MRFVDSKNKKEKIFEERGTAKNNKREKERKDRTGEREIENKKEKIEGKTK